MSVVANVLDHRLSILAGLPGAGETQSMRALVDLLHAPQAGGPALRADGQGRAPARRDDGRRGHDDPPPARVRPGGGFVRGPDDPIPGTDVLIVDEASMLGVRLAAALLDAVGRAPTSCSSVTSTSSPRSGPAGCWRT